MAITWFPFLFVLAWVTKSCCTHCCEGILFNVFPRPLIQDLANAGKTQFLGFGAEE